MLGQFPRSVPTAVPGSMANGAMGNARWTGVRLRDVLDRAGVKAGAVAVRSSGLEIRSSQGAPKFMKPLDIDHARDGEVMLAFQMNGEQLPLLNGFPMRLIVPGWYSDYWVKMLMTSRCSMRRTRTTLRRSAYAFPTRPMRA